MSWFHLALGVSSTLQYFIVVDIFHIICIFSFFKLSPINTTSISKNIIPFLIRNNAKNWIHSNIYMCVHIVYVYEYIEWKTAILEVGSYQLKMENRIENRLWTATTAVQFSICLKISNNGHSFLTLSATISDMYRTEEMPWAHFWTRQTFLVHTGELYEWLSVYVWLDCRIVAHKRNENAASEKKTFLVEMKN